MEEENPEDARHILRCFAKEAERTLQNVIDSPATTKFHGEYCSSLLEALPSAFEAIKDELFEIKDQRQLRVFLMALGLGPIKLLA